MSTRLEMLQVARLAPKALGEAASLVVDYLNSQVADDGGFVDRAGNSDLYYTAFGVAGLLAMQAPLPEERLVDYLRGFGEGDGLDFVHLACLARCWASLPPTRHGEVPRDAFLRRLEPYRAADGAFADNPGAERGTLYGTFLAVGMLQDLGAPITGTEQLVASVESLRTEDGGYANGPELPIGLTPPAAAAATLLRQFGHQPDARLVDWLLERHHPQGGFFATPLAPLPDLLSTATALHALQGMHADLRKVQEPCLDFLDSLWTNRGGFYGSWEDDTLDVEYTYYGLLALGHASLAG